MFNSIIHVLNELSENYDDAFWWRNRLLHRIVGPIQGIVYGRDGINVMAEDWDNLIILDACRADVFERIADINIFDEYKRVTSKASATPEFVNKTFTGQEFGDTVYINSNPHISRDAPGSFHHRYDLWSEAFNKEHGTVMPETSKNWGIKAESEHPDKRLIIHYNQPHGPYVGDERLKWDHSRARGSGEALKKGLITQAEFRAAYDSNLEAALPTAIELAEKLTGRTVITADHGELFGKRQFPVPICAYAHPPGLRDPDLTTVPWAVINGDERKAVSDDGTSVERVDSDSVERRLEDLGYKT
jgi:hypothetical protein